ncbi:MAG: OmpH family outer membrane protein [Flavobacteriales bacterium]|jgi:Skp family chaperone for outer membrane proteins|nr:OmpH family outer membrane protein [Flavobacteriales bacterium]MBK6551126.1 OmpH family outer membrane protein [Flavobacteriales bacterium]MBK6883658.1 OmpH family outer membrane protein [Flavobacteriales bacterium]MBK7101085.1 OmpH family outer membrane protein [Flavobacteriales bacterium]MBK7111802.1 OmpH family outer membrane protein [Flavobacteriales bacterium]
MSKNTTLLLVVWNVLLSALVAWGFMRTSNGPTLDSATVIPEGAEQMLPRVTVPRDTNALKEARIAYFYMDSIQKKYELIADKDKSFRAKRQQLESSLKKEMDKAQARYEELMKKDHTYSTQAEVAKDEQELQALMAKIQGQQANSEEELARMEGRILTEIIGELRGFLEVYNATAGFDYIFSVQNEGQVWVGNKDLDISDAIINGLNERYRVSKTAK